MRSKLTKLFRMLEDNIEMDLGEIVWGGKVKLSLCLIN
jgi:hypothetical protein